MKIHVISLPQSNRRRENIRVQFEKLGLRFDFFDAITGREALKHVHHYDDREFVRNCGRSASANEIACFASHLALWRLCAAGREPFLILEDDAHLCAGFRKGLNRVAQRINELGLIRVSVPQTRSFYKVERDGDFDIRYCRRVPLLAVGYTISPAAAARLMACGSVVREPVDKFIQRFWLHKQLVHALEPRIVCPDTVAEDSDIGDRHRPKYGLAVWLRRLLRKSENSVRRDVFVLRLLLQRSWSVNDRQEVPRKKETVLP